MKRLLVTGASGLLGFNLALRESAHREVTGVTYSQSLTGTPFSVIPADLTNTEVARNLIDRLKPDGIIHCAAMANIDMCEKQPYEAERVNSEVPGEIARICNTFGIRLVHLSTDAVFDGIRGGYLETDTPNPLSIYAQTKLSGEKSVLSANPEAVVARVNFYGWSLTGKRSLAEFFYYNLVAGNTVNGFTDVEFCPLFVDHLSALLLALLDGEYSGIYHVVSPNSLTKYDFGCRLAEIFGFDSKLIKPVSVQDGGLAARRSPRLTLNTGRLQNDLRITMPDLQDGIRAFAEQQSEGYPESITRFLN
jgi:dTDP-4-dehydrorhamnose reductase